MPNRTLLDDLRIEPEEALPSEKKTSTKRIDRTTLSGAKKPKSARYFLKGPVSLPWLHEAARLPGKALHVALQLRFWSGVRKQLTVRLNLSRLDDWGVHRSAASRALKRLEEAGLVAVLKKRGGAATVTIIEDRDAASYLGKATNFSDGE